MTTNYHHDKLDSRPAFKSCRCLNLVIIAKRYLQLCIVMQLWFAIESYCNDFLKYFLLLAEKAFRETAADAQMKKSALPERRDCRDFALFCCSDRDFFANWWWPISAAFTPFCKINFILCKKKYRVSSFFAHRDRVTAEKKLIASELFKPSELSKTTSRNLDTRLKSST